MSDASPAHELGPVRPLSAKEKGLIEKLLCGTGSAARARRQLANALVQDMADGGMGSIRFCAPSPEERSFGKEIAEASFRDADGVLVSVTLNVDQSGDLFELDVWKVDFSPLSRFPDAKDVEIIERHGQLGFPPAKS
jgi:hypothetical protein